MNMATPGLYIGAILISFSIGFIVGFFMNCIDKD